MFPDGVIINMRTFPTEYPDMAIHVTAEFETLVDMEMRLLLDKRLEDSEFTRTISERYFSPRLVLPNKEPSKHPFDNMEREEMEPFFQDGLFPEGVLIFNYYQEIETPQDIHHFIEVFKDSLIYAHPDTVQERVSKLEQFAEHVKLETIDEWYGMNSFDCDTCGTNWEGVEVRASIVDNVVIRGEFTWSTGCYGGDSRQLNNMPVSEFNELVQDIKECVKKGTEDAMKWRVPVANER